MFCGIWRWARMGCGLCRCCHLPSSCCLCLCQTPVVSWTSKVIFSKTLHLVPALVSITDIWCISCSHAHHLSISQPHLPKLQCFRRHHTEFLHESPHSDTDPLLQLHSDLLLCEIHSGKLVCAVSDYFPCPSLKLSV